ncbi:hypothetical protein WA158_003722 [Blastocystis sp. Blastoise]
MPKRSFSKRAQYQVLLNSDEKSMGDNLIVSSDGLRVIGDQGYRSIRITHKITEGTWFCECEILPSKNEKAHVRVGWETLECNVDTPVGYENISYGFRDVDGSAVNDGKRKVYGHSFGVGDVIGMLISIPGSNEKDKHQIYTPTIPLQVVPVIETTEETTKKVPKIIKDSTIHFYINGEDQGIAFKDIYEGNYYATISLYMQSVVTLNTGPNFKYPIQDLHYSPICDLAELNPEDERAKQRKKNNSDDETND